MALDMQTAGYLACAIHVPKIYLAIKTGQVQSYEIHRYYC